MKTKFTNGNVASAPAFGLNVCAQGWAPYVGTYSFFFDKRVYLPYLQSFNDHKEIDELIARMKSREFQFNRKGQSERPSLRDKIILRIFNNILTREYEQIFKDTSHWCRPQRNCHTAIAQIRKWSDITWVIEGDIKAFFSSINHNILADHLSSRIKDQNLIDLFWKLVKAGYVECEGEDKENSLGVPQGGIFPPILANIYLHPLDELVELLKKDRPIHYVRYADHWVLGFLGSRHDAEETLHILTDFLTKNLKLEVNKERTRITNVRQNNISFLGFDLRFTSEGRVKVYMPSGKIIKKLEERGLTQGYHAKYYGPWVNNSDYEIVAKYNKVLRGYLNYYHIVDELAHSFHKLAYVLTYSAAHTLACKHRSSLALIFAQYSSTLHLSQGDHTISLNWKEWRNKKIVELYDPLFGLMNNKEKKTKEKKK